MSLFDRDQVAKLTPMLRHPADIDKPLREAAKEKAKKYQHTYANNHNISFLPAIFNTSGRIDAEFLRLLFYHAHRESEEFFRLTGQLAQPNQDCVFSKRTAFFNGLKSKVGHIMAKATALRVNLNLALPPMAHERASSTFLKAVAFASRSFTPLFTIFSGPRPT